MNSEALQSADKLSEKFVQSIRVLFEILDEDKTGFVHVDAISPRWNGDKTVTIQLRKFATSAGFLTFESLCKAFRQVVCAKEVHKEKMINEESNEPVKYGFQSFLSESDLETKKAVENTYAQTLKSKSSMIYSKTKGGNQLTHNHRQRDQATVNNLDFAAMPLNSQFDAKFPKTLSMSSIKVPDHAMKSTLPRNNSRNSYMNRRSRESRRHTVGGDDSNIDHGMIRRAQLLDEERRTLEKGLEKIEKAKSWYLSKIENIKSKQGSLEQNKENWSIEACRDRLKLQNARIQELNQQLEALVLSSEKGLPLHMNLAFSETPNKANNVSNDNHHQYIILKSQKDKIEQQMQKLTEKVEQLENEKQTLIRDVFEARACSRKGIFLDDSTFM
ncbi:DgyrCDS12631 [Dimorphilus gyrociliatus]|uniref:DgyrCDS12631 n=1 Tax=Dimorphilus gyrociliatus TaxID=2664684 RepID=A0A7I8W804_9ANNE|nr:DgyrCDS12631 [Dimorphilus gyrociliatus]